METTIRVDSGVVSWGPAAGLPNGALAVVDVTEDAHRRLFVVLLDDRGAVAARSKHLPVDVPVQGGAIVAAEPGRALIVLRDRKVKTGKKAEVEYELSYDQPRWFACDFGPDGLKVEEVALWAGISADEIQGIAGPNGSTWSMVKTSYTTEPSISSIGRLAFGFGRDADLPTMHDTDIKCHSAAHTPLPDGSLAVLTVSDYSEARLWRASEDGHAVDFGAIIPPDQAKGEVSEPAVMPLRDGVLLVWRYFNGKTKKEERDGGLWFRTSGLDLSGLSDARRLGDDREIASGKWRTCRLQGGALVVWANGLSQKKQATRIVRTSSRVEVTEPQPLPGPLPDHVLRTDRGIMALTTAYSPSPYAWSLHAGPIDGTA